MHPTHSLFSTSQLSAETKFREIEKIIENRAWFIREKHCTPKCNLSHFSWDYAFKKRLLPSLRDPNLGFQKIEPSPIANGKNEAF